MNNFKDTVLIWFNNFINFKDCSKHLRITFDFRNSNFCVWIRNLKALNQYQELRHSCEKGKQSLVKFTKTNLCVFPRLWSEKNKSYKYASSNMDEIDVKGSASTKVLLRKV